MVASSEAEAREAIEAFGFGGPDSMLVSDGHEARELPEKILWASGFEKAE